MDEIHGDLILNGQFEAYGTLEEELVQRCIICTSPSKTFNLAGLLVSDIIIPNDQIRAAFQEKLAPYYLWPGNFGAAAQIAAYEQGEDWLEQLLDYLRCNAQYIGEFIAEKMPRVKYRPPGGHLSGLAGLSGLWHGPGTAVGLYVPQGPGGHR